MVLMKIYPARLNLLKYDAEEEAEKQDSHEHRTTWHHQTDALNF